MKYEKDDFVSYIIRLSTRARPSPVLGFGVIQYVGTEVRCGIWIRAPLDQRVESGERRMNVTVKACVPGCEEIHSGEGWMLVLI